MTKLLDDALNAARRLPPSEQDEIARVIMWLAGEDLLPPVALTQEERDAIARSKAAAARGEFATDEQVRAVWPGADCEALLYSSRAFGYRVHMRSHDVETVRLRPGMYIGDTADGSGLHNMVYEPVYGAVSEASGGYADRIDVVLNPDGSCTVRDNGRGFPTDIIEGEGVSAAEKIMTSLTAGAKFELWPNKFSGGSSVGMCVVNALSEWLELRISRNGVEHFLRCRWGEPEGSLAVIGKAVKMDGSPWRGTEVTFLPSSKIFAKVEFDFATLKHGLRELAGRNSDVNIVLTDQRDAKAS